MDNNDSKPQQTGGLKLMTVFIAVLALHVLVIGGFTVYHLMSSGGDADLALDKTHKLKADGTVVTDTATPDTASPDKSVDATAATETATTPSAPATTGTATAATGSATAPEANTPATDTATPTSAPAANPATSPAPTQVAANTPAATAPATPETKSGSSPIVLSGDDMGQTSTIPAQLLPPPDEPAAPSVPAAHPATTPSAPAVATIHDASGPIALTSKDGVEPMTAPAPLASTTPIGPVKPATASGPVHMPANPPAPSANVASHTEHVSASAHEKDAVASTHEAKKQTYTVKMTDTYKKIAESHHITVAELKAANHIKADAPMKTGQKLVIPSDKTSVAKSGATHDTSVIETASTASLSATPASAAKSHRHYYTVTKGDTLKYIAKKFNVTPSALEEANNLSGTKLAVGEKLRIPSHEAHATASTSTSSASLTERTIAPVAAPAPAAIQPSQVETQPAPVEQPTTTPVATPALEPQPTPASNPELTSLNF
jgi:LysM repeat protein